MHFVLTFIQIYFVCYTFGINVTTTQSKTPASTCGFEQGGPIVQQITEAIFDKPTGLYWVQDEMVFVDSCGPSCCSYRPYDDGKTLNANITELGDTFLHGMIPILNEERSYLLVADKSLHKGEFKGKFEEMTWTITKVMDIFVNFTWSLTKPHASKKHNLWAGANIAGIDQSEVVRVNIPKNKKRIAQKYGNGSIHGLAWNKQSSYMYTVSGNCVYRSVFCRVSDKAGKKEVIFDIQNYQRTIQGDLTCITVDEDENIWLGVSGPGMVIQYKHEYRQITQKISVPATNITNVQFGGHNFDKLIVATMRPENMPVAKSGPGALYAISGMNAKGFKPHWVDIQK